jgi:hypothetical protein
MGVYALLLSCAIIACNNESSQPESPEFTADESYLIDSYVAVKKARSYYPYQSAVGDSLFAGLSASIDTVRIERTITALNQTPDRWARVYQAIEDRLRDAGRQEAERKAAGGENGSERAGGGAGAPAEVQQNDEHH